MGLGALLQQCAVSMPGWTVSIYGGSEAGSHSVVSKLSVLVVPMGEGRGEALLMWPRGQITPGR